MILPVRTSFNRLTIDELYRYIQKNNIRQRNGEKIPKSMTKTGMISHIMGTKKADDLRKDADNIISKRKPKKSL